jgi:hypothetical protein
MAIDFSVLATITPHRGEPTVAEAARPARDEAERSADGGGSAHGDAHAAQPREERRVGLPDAVRAAGGRVRRHVAESFDALLADVNEDALAAAHMSAEG